MTLPLADIWTPADQLWRIAPELALVATLVAVLVVSIFTGRNPYVAAGVALAGMLATLLLTGALGREAVAGGSAGLGGPTNSPVIVTDAFSVFFKLFLLLFLALVMGLWLAGLSFRRRAAASLVARPVSVPPANAPEFLTLLLASALGMILMVSTLNLLMIVLAIELASLPSYALAGFDKRSRLSAEASVKYVVFGAVTAAIMLYGVSLLYGCYGTLDIPRIAQAVAAGPDNGAFHGPVSAAGLFALGVGIAFKIAAVPFHFWCPDVFEGAPVEVTTWLSVSSKAAGLGLAARIVAALISPADAARLESLWGPTAVTIGIFASLTCTIGNFAAYRQDNVKRILAYSSIAHAGYMLMAAAVLLPYAPHAANPVFSALIVYMLTYLFMNLGAFAVTAVVSWQTGSESLATFANLGRRAPWIAVPMTICLFSLVGLPPLGGFLAKWWLLYALGEGAAAQPWLWALVLVLAINTLFSLYYYVRIVIVMFVRDEPRAERDRALPAPFSVVVMVNACAAILLLLGTVGARPMKTLADNYAIRLFTGAARASDPMRLLADGPRATTMHPEQDIHGR